MRRYFFYIIINIVYQLIAFWILIYLAYTFNDSLIPESLKWKNNAPRDDFFAIGFQALIFMFEATILTLLIYIINSLVLSDTHTKESRFIIAKRTAIINMIVFAGFFICCI
ncbi:MAG: hypothetical protein ABJB05_13080 [Parafilimonas sp.]